MRVILNTHAFLWFIEGRSELSSEARRWIEDPQHEKLLSVASAWEMTMKASIGNLSLGQPLHILIPQQLLIAQSMVEGSPLISADTAFDSYAGLARLW